MLRTASLSAAMVSLVLASPAMANDDPKPTPAEEVVTAVAAEEAITPVKLVSFDGELELLQKSSRLRIWRSHIAYELKVDAEGNVTDCELTEKFRRRYVSAQLCKLLSANHTFEPAHDASGKPVEGSFTNRISYMDLRAKR